MLSSNFTQNDFCVANVAYVRRSVLTIRASFGYARVGKLS